MEVDVDEQRWMMAAYGARARVDVDGGSEGGFEVEVVRRREEKGKEHTCRSIRSS